MSWWRSWNAWNDPWTGNKDPWSSGQGAGVKLQDNDGYTVYEENFPLVTPTGMKKQRLGDVNDENDDKWTDKKTTAATCGSDKDDDDMGVPGTSTDPAPYYVDPAQKKFSDEEEAKQYFCESCEMILNGRTQYEDHLKSRKHRWHLNRNKKDKQPQDESTVEVVPKATVDVLVCHGNVIRYFVMRGLQLPPEAWLRQSLNNGSITQMYIRDDIQ